MRKSRIHVLSRGVLIEEGQILLCKTLDLPVNFYFLPGGHVEEGESAYDTVLREFREEVGAECSIKRFLGCLEYSFEPGYSSIYHEHEYNFIFELGSNSLKPGKPIPQLEAHIACVWVPLSQLSEIDFRAEPLKEFVPAWLRAPASEAFRSEMTG